jgi:hypothetical protein
MTAKVLVAGAIVLVDNRYLAVWVREQGVWKFAAYQPTPIVNGQLCGVARRLISAITACRNACAVESDSPRHPAGAQRNRADPLNHEQNPPASFSGCYRPNQCQCHLVPTD